MISRRKFLALLPAMLVVNPADFPLPKMLETGQAAPADFLSWFSDPAAVRQLGRQIQGATPIPETELNDLLAGWMQCYERSGESACRHWLAGRIQQDFELEKLQVVDGWVLSQTEAQVAVLMSEV